jgi:multidrug transporter EmrE-like cation transporter
VSGRDDAPTPASAELLPDRIAALADDVVRRYNSRLRAFTSWALLVVGVLTITLGATMMREAVRPEVAVDTAAALLFGGGGLATVIAGLMLVFRQRIEAAERILTVLAGSTFALALALLPGRPQAGESMLTIGVIFAGALASTVLLAPVAP